MTPPLYPTPRLLGAMACLLLAVGCTAAAQTPPEKVRPGEPDPFLSEEVTVSGQVADVFPDRGFLLSGDDVRFGAGPGTLVLTPGGADVDEGAYARVRGTVSMLDLADAQSSIVQQYGKDFLIGFDGEYVVTAETVEAVDRPGSDVSMLRAELEDQRDLRETLTLSAQVQDVIAPQVFAIEGRDDSVLVLAHNRPEVDQGDVVEMTGEVMRFDPAEIQSATGIILRSDVADQVRQHAGDIVFVARQVTVVDLNEN